MCYQSVLEERESKGVFQRILVAIDDSEPARWAIRMAVRLAKVNGAALAFVHVTPCAIAMTPDFAMLRAELVDNHRELGEALLKRVALSIVASPRPELLLREGEPSQQIIAAAREWRADVIIVGTHGRGAVAHMLLGSTAESVVRHAHAPVLTVGCDPDKPREQPRACAGVAGCKCGRTEGKPVSAGLEV